ncbi:unnamed protein product [Nezara viridula]|uniref:Peptidase M1 membrane alanine aminopeptidase domain-containing protein n=1 Tax=Nezara viridula TaxID=85310 RepID=A0A9P0MRP8_NEZVI|nr:unnamed protein product [Nezara viridula]
MTESFSDQDINTNDKITFITPTKKSDSVMHKVTNQELEHTMSVTSATSQKKYDGPFSYDVETTSLVTNFENIQPSKSKTTRTDLTISTKSSANNKSPYTETTMITPEISSHENTKGFQSSNPILLEYSSSDITEFEKGSKTHSSVQTKDDQTLMTKSFSDQDINTNDKITFITPTKKSDSVMHKVTNQELEHTTAGTSATSQKKYDGPFSSDVETTSLVTNFKNIKPSKSKTTRTDLTISTKSSANDKSPYEETTMITPEISSHENTKGFQSLNPILLDYSSSDITEFEKGSKTHSSVQTKDDQTLMTKSFSDQDINTNDKITFITPKKKSDSEMHKVTNQELEHTRSVTSATSQKKYDGPFSSDVETTSLVTNFKNIKPSKSKTTRTDLTISTKSSANDKSPYKEATMITREISSHENTKNFQSSNPILLEYSSSDITEFEKGSKTHSSVETKDDQTLMTKSFSDQDINTNDKITFITPTKKSDSVMHKVTNQELEHTRSVTSATSQKKYDGPFSSDVETTSLVTNFKNIQPSKSKTTRTDLTISTKSSANDKSPYKEATMITREISSHENTKNFQSSNPNLLEYSSSDITEFEKGSKTHSSVQTKDDQTLMTKSFSDQDINTNDKINFITPTKKSDSVMHNVTNQELEHTMSVTSATSQKKYDGPFSSDVETTSLVTNFENIKPSKSKTTRTYLTISTKSSANDKSPYTETTMITPKISSHENTKGFQSSNPILLEYSSSDITELEKGSKTHSSVQTKDDQTLMTKSFSEQYINTNDKITFITPTKKSDSVMHKVTNQELEHTMSVTSAMSQKKYDGPFSSDVETTSLVTNFKNIKPSKSKTTRTDLTISTKSSANDKSPYTETTMITPEISSHENTKNFQSSNPILLEYSSSDITEFEKGSKTHSSVQTKDNQTLMTKSFSDQDINTNDKITFITPTKKSDSVMHKVTNQELEHTMSVTSATSQKKYDGPFSSDVETTSLVTNFENIKPSKSKTTRTDLTISTKSSAIDKSPYKETTMITPEISSHENTKGFQSSNPILLEYSSSDITEFEKGSKTHSSVQTKDDQTLMTKSFSEQYINTNEKITFITPTKKSDSVMHKVTNQELEHTMSVTSATSQKKCVEKYIDVSLYDLLMSYNKTHLWGRVALTINVSCPLDQIVLDFEGVSVYSSSLNEIMSASQEKYELAGLKSMDYHKQWGKIMIELTNAIKPEHRYILSLEFISELSPFERGATLTTYFTRSVSHETKQKAWIIGTFLYPTFGKLMFPCIVTPERRSIFHLRISRSKDVEAVSNTIKKKTELLRKDGLMDDFYYTPAIPISSFTFYLLPKYDSFIVERTPSLAFWFPPYLKYSVDEIFKIANGILDFFIEYFQFNLPIQQISVIVSEDLYSDPPASFATILISSKYLFEKYESNYENKEEVYHFLGKQFCDLWMGNIISFNSWNDNWLKEGFSIYMAHLATMHMYNDYDFSSFIIRIQQNAFRYHRFPVLGENKLHKHKLYTNNKVENGTPSKGAFLLHMVQNILKPEPFQEAIRFFFKKWLHLQVQIMITVHGGYPSIT